MNRYIDSATPRPDTKGRPNHTPNRAVPGGAMPAMPESPIPDWDQRNRTPDPLERHWHAPRTRS